MTVCWKIVDCEFSAKLFMPVISRSEIRETERHRIGKKKQTRVGPRARVGESFPPLFETSVPLPCSHIPVFRQAQEFGLWFVLRCSDPAQCSDDNNKKSRTTVDRNELEMCFEPKISSRAKVEPSRKKARLGRLGSIWARKKARFGLEKKLDLGSEKSSVWARKTARFGLEFWGNAQNLHWNPLWNHKSELNTAPRPGWPGDFGCHYRNRC